MRVSDTHFYRLFRAANTKSSSSLAGDAHPQRIRFSLELVQSRKVKRVLLNTNLVLPGSSSTYLGGDPDDSQIE